MAAASNLSSSSQEQSLATLASGILNHGLLALNSSTHWQRLYFSAFPLLASAVWYLARTVISVTDDEQSLWIQMWLSQQSSALRRVRRLQLSSGKLGPSRDPYGRGRHQREDDEEDKEEDGGRFAPPKLDFQPDAGVVTWAWFGWWPVTIQSAQESGGMDPYHPKRSGIRQGYSLTIWFAPLGTSVARSLLFEGRKLWLAKRAKKTEIWMVGGDHGPGRFRIVTRPSRPLSSVIVEGNTKEMLREDAIHFLNAERWYVSKGVPYRRGYLLHGPPGCGKTSLITALAGDLRLPIVLIPLNDRNMDDRQLMSLMGEAPRNSLVLIEDIDCALPPSAAGGRAAAAVRDRYGRMPVTLSGLLNAIDGVGAQEGRLLFMTTNYLDRLDEALIRPGRVDAQYHLDKASKTGAGELFDQFFNSATTQEEFPAQVIEKSRKAFVEKVEDGKFSFASLQGVFMEGRGDPNKIPEGMDRLSSTSSSSVKDPTKESAYDKVMAFEKETEEALERERKSEQAQREAGKPVVKRLVGNPVHTVHNTVLQQIIYCGCFPTFGSPELLKTSGVLYYELEVIKAYRECQLGFALKDGVEMTEVDTGEGIGDNDKSWAVDGVRKQLWHKSKVKWEGFWQEGDRLGLAANMDTGMIAISKNGIWDDSAGESGLGVVFTDELIKQGVYPAFTASHHTLRYYVGGDENLKHGPPPASVWKSSPSKDIGESGGNSQLEKGGANGGGKENGGANGGGKENGNSGLSHGE